MQLEHLLVSHRAPPQAIPLHFLCLDNRSQLHRTLRLLLPPHIKAFHIDKTIHKHLQLAGSVRINPMETLSTPHPPLPLIRRGLGQTDRILLLALISYRLAQPEVLVAPVLGLEVTCLLRIRMMPGLAREITLGCPLNQKT